MSAVINLKAPSAPLQWTEGRTRVGEVELFWQQAGPEDGKPLLLIMGLSWQLIHWPESFCADLVARGFRVIRFDNRDSGLSSEVNRKIRFNLPQTDLRKKLGMHVDANYTLHDMAADTAGLIQALGFKRVHLAGISMGGMISQIVAGTYPHLVSSLTSIMSTTNHPWLPPPKLPIVREMIFNKPKDLSKPTIVARDITIRKLIASPAYPTSEADMRSIAEAAYDRAFKPAGTLRQTHAIVATGSFEPALKNITAPTHIVHGLADPLVRVAGGKRSAKLIKDAKLTLIEGMGHDLPESLTPRLAEIIAENAARG